MKISILFSAMLVAAYGPLVSQSQLRPSVAISPDDIEIAYEVHGNDTPALVFVHGWSCDRRYWKGQIKPFVREFKVVVLDLAGHGESGLQRKAWTIEAFGGDVASVVMKLGLQRVILIGHSMGGDVIAEAARQLPGKVAGLIMVDTYKKLGPGRPAEEVQALIAPFRKNFAETTRAFVRSMFLPGSDSTLVEHVAADMSSAPPAIALAAVESALNYSREISGALQALNLPVIAINPDNSPTDHESMTRHHVEVIVIAGVGHFLMMEDPENFNRILRSAIDKFKP